MQLQSPQNARRHQYICCKTGQPRIPFLVAYHHPDALTDNALVRAGWCTVFANGYTGKATVYYVEAPESLCGAADRYAGVYVVLEGTLFH